MLTIIYDHVTKGAANKQRLFVLCLNRLYNQITHKIKQGGEYSSLSYALAAFTIAVNLSVLRDAPPIRPPSTLGFARSSAALPSFIEPPY